MAIKLKTIQTEIEVTESLACDNCGVDIALVFDKPDGPTDQGENALIVVFSGGYGMYIDPLGEWPERFKMLWCKQCADKLCEQFPSIDKRLHGKWIPELAERTSESH